jgi:hypothetical protein
MRQPVRIAGDIGLMPRPSGTTLTLGRTRADTMLVNVPRHYSVSSDREP